MVGRRTQYIEILGSKLAVVPLCLVEQDTFLPKVLVNTKIAVAPSRID